MKIDKSIVLSRFSKALGTYDEAATVQQLVASEMLQLIQEVQPTFFPQRILELGCGTGSLTSRLVEQFGSEEITLTLNDIVPDVQQVLAHRIACSFDFLLGDAEHIGWVDHQDLIISNCSIQWWDNLTYYFRKALQYTDEHAIVAASIFEHGHFRELDRILPHSLHYPTLEEIASQLEGLGYSEITYRSEKQVLEFQTLLDLLRHIKATGANAFTQKASVSWTPTRLQQLETTMRYDLGISEEQPLTLTYKPLIIVAKR